MSYCLIIFLVILSIVALVGLFKLYLILSMGWDRSPTCLIGKTVIVTGSNSGIGFYTAQDFAKRGARVILACRNPQRAEEARAKIVEATGNSNVVVKLVDFASLESVREFAKEILETEEQLDILVNNAGAGGFNHTISKDGLSLSFQINHFGPFLLTVLLLGLLKKSAPSRIIFVSSDAARFAKLNVINLNAEPDGFFKKARDYANAKLCNILIANELARKLKDSGVNVNSVHPGAVQSDFFQHLPDFQKRIGNSIMRAFYKSTDGGAQTSIYAAVSKEVAGISGEYFSDCRKGWMPKAGRDEELAKKVWEKSEECVKLTPEERTYL